MLHGRRFPPKPKETVYKSYIRPAILYGSEAWCVRESEMGFLQRTERSMVRAMCGVQLKDRKINGESNVWSAAQRQKKIYRFDVDAGLDQNYISIGYGEQCSLAWSCDEERVMRREGH